MTDPRPLIDPDLSATENLARLRDLKHNTAFERDRIQKAIDVLEKQNKAWSDLIRAQEDEESQAKEEKLYATTVAKEDSFIVIWDSALEKLSLFDVLQMEIQEAIQEMKMEDRRDSTINYNGLNVTNSGGENNQEASNFVARSQVKLPKVELLPYYGDPLKWKAFWDAYESNVHKQLISDVQKFNYLRFYCKGAAFHAIDGIAVTNANYSEAIDILTKRFGDPQLIKESLYAELNKVPIVHAFRIRDLRILVDSTDKLFRQLSAIGEDIEQSSLIVQLQEKLPPAVMLKLEEQYKPPEETNWSIYSLRKALAQLVGVQERISRLSIVQPRSPPPQQVNNSGPFQRPRGRFANNQQPPHQYGRSSTEGFHVATSRPEQGQQQFTNQSQNSRNQPVQMPFQSPSFQNQLTNRPFNKPKSPCLLCSGPHFNDQCPVYSSADSRRKRLSELNRCFLCMRIGCHSQRCQEPLRSCYHCQQVGQHCRLLCPSLFQLPAGRANQRAHRPSVRPSTRGGGGAQSSSSRTPVSNLPRRNGTGPIPVHVEMTSSLQPGSQDDPSADGPGQESHPQHPVQELSVGYTGKFPLNSAFLLTATVSIAHPDRRDVPITARVFLDCGSQRSFITARLVTQLKLSPMESETLSIHTFASQKPCIVDSQVVQFTLFLQTGATMVIQANALSKLTGMISRGQLSAEDLQVLSQLPEKLLAEPVPCEPESFEPDILIGLDYFWDLIEAQGKQRLPSGLYLVPSKLGLILGGTFPENTETQHAYVVMATEDSRQPVKKLPDLEEFWKLETIGITDSPVDCDDDKALSHFNATVKFENDRYKVSWPWKSEMPNLPDNYWLAFNRFKGLTKRFQEDPELLQKYSAIIEDQLKKGIIEKVFPDSPGGQLQHYLPHHPVITPQKTTTKVRIVYDASAKQNAKASSLNECLFRGPVLLPDLCGLLLRFRMHPIAMTADVEKAFLQIGLHIPDRDVTRFFWFQDPSRPQLQDNIQIYRFCRVTFGVISSPFLLSGTVKYHLQKKGTPLALKIINNVYVDNVLMGADSAEEANQMYLEAKKLFQEASLNLREWTTNSIEFLNKVPEVDKIVAEKVKVLGILWNVKSDQLKIKTSKSETSFPEVPTKRQLLNVIASVFDPLGFLAPVTVLGKSLLQKLWKMKIEWDSEIPQLLQEEWRTLVSSISQAAEISINRYMGENVSTSENSLLIFADASKVAYAAVVYLRMETNAKVATKLLFAKTRLASEGTSLPRLELMAMVIGVRMAKFISSELHCPIKSIKDFSDSECTLQWLTSVKPLSVFVTNRVKEIKDTSENLGISFQYVPTKDNPADCASRGLTTQELINHSLWWNGPSWLQKTSDDWPSGNLPVVSQEVLKSIATEERPKIAFQTSSMPLPVDIVSSPVIPVEQFSSLKKVSRTAAYILRFLKVTLWNKLSGGMQAKFPMLQSHFAKVGISGPLKTSEVYVAKLLLEKQVQAVHYEDIITALMNKKSHTMVNQLGLQLDANGLIRCHGRLQHADLPCNAKFPKLLPPCSHFTTLVIRQCHEKSQHAGLQHTLAAVRQEYWIPSGRQTTKKVLRKCATCKKAQGGAYQLPAMPALPAERVTRARPFQFTGLDYFGPMWVKVGSNKEKAWICLFTCFVTRVIHLELVLDLSAFQFLNCLRRFIARRGKPSKIISDNAPAFKLTQGLLAQLWKNLQQDSDVWSYLSSEGIKWEFITEYAPWQGGLYERMVGLVKQGLRKSIGKRMLTSEEAQTLLCEAEAVVNSRPLTYVSDDVQSQQILRPIDFLVPNASIGTFSLEEDASDPEYLPKKDSKQQLLELWRKSQKQVDEFWNYWSNEYLVSLRERFQVMHKTPRIRHSDVPKEGDLVLIKKENLARGSWLLGRINKLLEGHDGKIRSAEVQLPNKKLLTRPVNHLYPTETEENPTESQRMPDVPSTSSPATTATHFSIPITSTNFLLFLTCLLLFCPGHFAAECNVANESDLKVNFKPIYSPKCTEKGIVVLQKKGGTICWKYFRCIEGELDGKGQCATPCSCPKWAFKCSHPEGANPVARGNTDVILKVGKVRACSFSPSPRCSDKPRMETLNQIELFNGTKVFVNSLAIHWVQATVDQYQCIGEGLITGTPEFCANHKCKRRRRKFCYYTTREIAFYSNPAGEVPVRAYGSVDVLVYDHPKPSPKQPTICFECNIQCVKGGVQVTVNKGVNFMEVCSLPFCYKLSFPQVEQTIFLPASVNLVDHEVTVKVWSQGSMVKRFVAQCPAEPFCEMISCYLCLARVRNLHCSSTAAVFLIAIGLYFLSITLYLLVKALSALRSTFKVFCSCLWFIFHCCWMLLRRVRNCTFRSAYAMVQQDNQHAHQPDNESVNRRRKNHRSKLPYFVALLVLLHICTTDACFEISSLTAQESQCLTSAMGEMECKINEVSRLSLTPQGQLTCLLIHGANDDPIGTITVEVKNIALKCQKKTEYFTRSYSMKSQGVKRCPLAGSCTIMGCSTVKINSRIEELDDVVNDSPGFSYCQESCGCWACGCFMCKSGCMFYRTYASPESDAVYEVFSCPNWEYKVEVELKITENNKTTSHNLILTPGIPRDWDNVEVTLISITEPPVPIMGNYFVTDGSSTVLTRASARGQPVSGTVGSLQCGTFTAAAEFNCGLPHDSCQCQSQEYRVSCTCVDGILEPLFENSEYKLPLIMKGVSILSDNDNGIEAEYEHTSSLEVQISLNDMTLRMQVDKSLCKVNALNLTGCYSCLVGAKLRFTCTTDFGESLAHVTCDEGVQFSTVCHPQEVHQIPRWCSLKPK